MGLGVEGSTGIDTGRERRSPLPAEHTPMGGGLWPFFGLAGLRLDRLVELQLAVLDLVDAVVGERGVAVLVDRVGAEDAVAVLGVEQRLLDVFLRAVAGALDRVQREAHGLIAVDRV